MGREMSVPRKRDGPEEQRVGGKERKAVRDRKRPYKESRRYFVVWFREKLAGARKRHLENEECRTYLLKIRTHKN